MWTSFQSAHWLLFANVLLELFVSIYPVCFAWGLDYATDEQQSFARFVCI